MLSALALLTVAAASEPWHPRGNVEVLTSFPTDVGLRGTFEGPGRVRLTASAGLLPRPYLDAINDTATANAWYDDTISIASSSTVIALLPPVCVEISSSDTRVSSDEPPYVPATNPSVVKSEYPSVPADTVNVASEYIFTVEM